MSEIFRLPSEFSPDVAKNFIKVAEGLKLEAYRCSAGVWTCGYGHARGVKRGDRITEEEADRLLEKDLKECHRALHKWVRQCTEGQYIAMMSFVFNFGETRFANSTLLTLHNQEKYKEAAEEFGRWVYATDPKTGKKVVSNGLVTRRREEKKQYLRGLV
ncbi:lysozyme [uncultured Parasutterella sp.]|uniref:lysozyme n=1 Tax=uncultured Parasutterella sp. TaxID=1263098 RepID=UPI00259344C7|nr:lysozyme [uncultured Parasutterella sp.]